MSDLETMKRYEFDYLGDAMDDPEGKWVRYDDAASIIQHHEATIAELNNRISILGAFENRANEIQHREEDCLRILLKIRKVLTGSIHSHDDIVECARNLRSDLAAAQATIRDLERELEEADREIIFCWNHAQKFGLSFGNIPSSRVYRSAVARHSARAQQAEAKKGE